ISHRRGPVPLAWRIECSPGPLWAARLRCPGGSPPEPSAPDRLEVRLPSPAACRTLYPTVETEYSDAPKWRASRSPVEGCRPDRQKWHRSARVQGSSSAHKKSPTVPGGELNRARRKSSAAPAQKVAAPCLPEWSARV